MIAGCVILQSIVIELKEIYLVTHKESPLVNNVTAKGTC